MLQELGLHLKKWQAWLALECGGDEDVYASQGRGDDETAGPTLEPSLSPYILT